MSYRLCVTHLMAESWVVMWINWSSIYATRKLSPPSLWPCSLSLRGIALQWISNTLSEQHAQKTHTLSLWHTFYAYFQTGKVSPRPAPPHSHTNRRECFVLSLTAWAATEERERERGWWEEVDGDSKRQKDYKEKQTQTDREEEIQLAKGAEETHLAYTKLWKDRVSRTGKGIQK